MDSDEKYFRGLAARIVENGFTLIGVFDDEGNDPPFVYSIGLTERGWPEVIMITACMRPQTIEILLTDLISRWFKDEKVTMGDNKDLIFMRDGSSHGLRVVEVANTPEVVNKYGCQVPLFFEEEAIKFVQVLWPDTAGKFPDEEGYSTEPHMIQPLLSKVK